MTKLMIGPTEFGAALIVTAALLLVSAPASAQESPSKVDTRPDPASIPALSSPVRLGVVEERVGRPDTLLGVPASRVLLSGLKNVRVLRIPASPPADEDVAEEDRADEDQAVSDNVDAWGVAPNAVLATTLVILSNIAANVVNEYVLQGNISQINPDSWWHNVKQGMSWDDNQFSTNFFAHPYQGSVYYNAARANGFNYWESLPFTALGSFTWECCGETHLMSVNDFFNTTVGGAMLGEIFYRLSSTILDNESEGSERAWREAGVVALNPGRGVTRIMTGRAFNDDTNPTEPLDYRGNRIFNTFNFGYRMVGEGDRLDFSQDEAHFFVEMDLSYGNLFDMERNKPFDFFTLAVQLNFRDKKGLGRIQARGTLRNFELSRSETRQQLFSIAHYFDYIDNNAYEFGGQSIGFIYLSNWIRSERTRIVVATDIHAMLMGGVNTEYSEFAEIPGVRERDREYDFGSGFGSWLQFQVVRDEYQIVDLSYRINWIRTLNGTNVGGQNTDHIIQQATLRLGWPLSDTWGVAVESSVFLRNSYFEEDFFDDVRQRNPELRVLGSWTVGSRGVN